jgi:flagellar FliJ protein
MKKFKYRLESLLKIKEHIEKEKQKAHAYAMKRVQDQLAELDDIERTKMDTLEGQRVAMTGRISLAEALVYSRYIMKLKKDRVTGDGMLNAFEKAAEKKRGELVEASRERQIYEKLKEKLKERYIKEHALDERKQADETATTRFVRNSSEER